ncbi:DMT family transporter [Enterococcus gallinarum]|uniref:DMT family transporter n=1 Tax=Enterococcus gallinarum TaxID=1353 RepID=UPI003D6B9DB7
MNHLFKNTHVTALITVFFWSTTFIATKLLLIDFSPTAILFLRFIIGLVALSVLSKFSRIHYHFRQHLYLMAAGISGVCFYFFLENIALSYTSTSNVAVIVSISPLFIGLASALIYRTKLKGTFFIGFLLSFCGIFLISFAGNLSFHPFGDFLAIAAALMWMVYSLLVKKIASWGHSVIDTTKMIFLYGILFIMPLFFLTKSSLSLDKLLQTDNLLYLLFLGLGASALCFVLWNYTVEQLGAVMAGLYIYLVPVTTLFASFLILGEGISLVKLLGVTLTLFGLFVSEGKSSLPIRARLKKTKLKNQDE